ncbi:MAG: hypothetical protein DRJ03_08085 [Chloroflexi bacterium]|nr:MAG: hypothetical protein DRJ03_08085 [Chloroflexota bacterium]
MPEVSGVLICPVVKLRDWKTFLELSQKAKYKVYRYAGRLDAQALLKDVLIEISVFKSDYRRKFYEEAIEKDSELKELEAKLEEAHENRDWDWEDKLRRAIKQKRDWHREEAERKATQAMEAIIKILKDNGFVEGSITGVEVFVPPTEWMV